MMSSTNALDSSAFRRLTNRERPSLPHPTSRKFDEAIWRKYLESVEGVTSRDLDLFGAALYFFYNLENLRNVYGGAFDGVSREDFVKLSVAQSNRAYLVAASRLKTHISKLGEGVTAFDKVVDAPIGGNKFQPNLTPDDVITAVVDCLPHWLYQASLQPETQTPQDIDWRSVGANGEAMFSIEHGIRDLWQAAVWEGCSLAPIDSNIVFGPSDIDAAETWAAWQFRQRMISTQWPLRLSVEGRGGAERVGVNVPEKTVTALSRNGKTLRFKIGATAGSIKRSNAFLFDMVERSYLSPFIDEPVNACGVTPRMLVKAWLVISRIARLLVAELRRSEIYNKRDVSDLSLGVPLQQIVNAFRDCLSIDREMAKTLADSLMTDPANIASVFKMGIWHRPLIRHSGDVVLISAPSILAGSPIRIMERWLLESGVDANFSSSERGFAYEDALRRSLVAAIEENEILTDAECAPEGVKISKDGDEEIDLLLHVGKVLIVGEVKCFIVPSESSEKYDHLRKLESAASQVQRKAEWLKANWSVVRMKLPKFKFGIDEADVISLVILNHGIGVGLRIGSAVVTDANFIKIFFGGGSYVSGMVANLQSGENIPRFEEMYRTQSEAERVVVDVFRNPPGVKKYREAIKWEVTKFPSASGRAINILTPRMELNECVG